MAGTDPADDLTWPVALHEREPLRVAYSEDLGFAPVEPSVRKAFKETVAKLPWIMQKAHPPPIPPTALWNAIALPEGYASEGPLLAEHEDQMTAGTAEIIREGAVSANEYLDAQHERSLYTRAWAEFFADYDLLLIPTMQMTAFPVGMLSPGLHRQPADRSVLRRLVHVLRPGEPDRPARRLRADRRRRGRPADRPSDHRPPLGGPHGACGCGAGRAAAAVIRSAARRVPGAA
jgi:Asp-tRNA(Asn)/Glu-tRNA(Gln) amidotransferase A subunit family amidase